MIGDHRTREEAGVISGISSAATCLLKRELAIPPAIAEQLPGRVGRFRVPDDVIGPRHGGNGRDRPSRCPTLTLALDELCCTSVAGSLRGKRGVAGMQDGVGLRRSVLVAGDGIEPVRGRRRHGCRRRGGRLGRASLGDLVWWPGTESNRRHEHFQCPALPTELPGRRERRIRPAARSEGQAGGRARRGLTRRGVRSPRAGRSPRCRRSARAAPRGSASRRGPSRSDGAR